MKVEKDIKNYKERLIRKVKRIGLWENLGQEEVGILRSKYSDHRYRNDGIWDKIKEFDNWCMNYIGI